MNPKIIITEDGSNTLFVPSLNENYHSSYGAIQESRHIFINTGFLSVKKTNINIFEIGFGTGLNALLTYIEASKNNQKTYYETIELYPLEHEIIKALNYPQILTPLEKDVFFKIHSTWNEEIEISDFFTIKKIKADLIDFKFDKQFDLVYFDAFSPEVQPEMWTKEIFEKIFKQLNINGVLTTYSAKGSVKRILKETGFKIEKLSGPPGKREIIRATKLKNHF
ncbi:MAG: tRNA (5-methylaminomethyl-2-thiouridine)(34)-methyltransferase MnmD [Bacteroidales bacterium]|nr:tRNA (5-methylaminomethyl-2-thiouridine)(34)-methyltransferase MnmD [Bacteroidales bacterium]